MLALYGRLQRQMFKVDRVLGMHEVHLWQLVDGVVIGTLHLKVARGGDDNKVRDLSQLIITRSDNHV